MIPRRPGLEAEAGVLKIRVRLAVLEAKGTLFREAELEIRDETTLERFLKGADKALGLKNKVFGQTLKGRLKAAVLLNGDRVDPGRAKGIILRPKDEISLLSGPAGG